MTHARLAYYPGFGYYIEAFSQVMGTWIVTVRLSSLSLDAAWGEAQDWIDSYPEYFLDTRLYTGTGSTPA
jgi:hypothetical protein